MTTDKGAGVRETASGKEPKVCPECGHVFQGNGFDGIDAHWRARHNDIERYEEAWPSISAGTYKRKG